MKKYSVIVSGGTFDKFHTGHKDFLRFQLGISGRILVGVTSDVFARAKSKGQIDSYTERRDAVLNFIRSEYAEERIKVEKIDSVYIPEAWKDEPIEAVAVTADTTRGADLINDERKKNGLPVLPVEVFAMTMAKDGRPVSSSRIREGHINRDGDVYVSPDLLKRDYALPDSLRNTLKDPIGTLIKDNRFDFRSLPMGNVVTVGDVATLTFLKRGLIPKISIVDFVIERRPAGHSLSGIGFSGTETTLHAVNPPSRLTSQFLNAVHDAFSRPDDSPIVIAVDGEEDLGVLPVLLSSPLGYHVFYGQPGEGLVKVDVTEEKKGFAARILSEFTVSK